MATYPTEPEARLGSSSKKKYNVLKNSFEANYMQVRKASTRSRSVFTLRYDNITKDEYAIIEAFFDANIGTIFTYINPENSLSYQVSFQNNELDYQATTKELCSTSVILEEI